MLDHCSTRSFQNNKRELFYLIRGKTMKLTFYGGVKEIGGNKILLQKNKTGVLLDFGTSMGYESDFFSDFLQPRKNTAIFDRLTIGALPKINGIYRENAFIPEGIDLLNDSKYSKILQGSSEYIQPPIETYEEYIAHHKTPFVQAILLTHAHLDHTGAIGYLHQSIPLYCTKVTQILVKAIDDVTSFTSEALTIRSKQLELQSDKATFPKSPTVKTNNIERPCRTLKDMERTTIGDLTITLVEQDHSVPGSASFIVESDGKRLLYTGDIRFHGTHPLTTEEYAKKVGKPVDIMICEGTRIDSDMVVTENNVQDQITKDIQNTKGLVFVDFSWKDTTRYETIRKACERAGRILVINARLAYLLHELNIYPNNEKVKVFLKRKGSCLYSPGDYITTKHELGFTPKKKKPDITHYEHGLLAEDIKKQPEKYVIMLSYFDLNQLFDLANGKGIIPNSRLIKAQCAPFSDEMELDEERYIHWLDTFGISYTLDEIVVADYCRDPGCEKPRRFLKRSHVSGHAARPELKELIDLIHPHCIIPVHTMHPELFDDIAKGIDKTIKVIKPVKGQSYIF